MVHFLGSATIILASLETSWVLRNEVLALFVHLYESTPDISIDKLNHC
uniref:Uncharacterized protein n=1 Tax=Utricularia reniformis TaxID=192314 RepID=A0A1Y0AYV9_9LAMI|nr:hypothetical protein AEK19_MT1009 [Utricularia reniformis]ART30341.1 hypothetical protein AEK19_MT1009 [Utricularia reniformis]